MDASARLGRSERAKWKSLSFSYNHSQSIKPDILHQGGATQMLLNHKVGERELRREVEYQRALAHAFPNSAGRTVQPERRVSCPRRDKRELSDG